MSRLPVVSIVTPCLNPGGRLVRCLDSVAAQTYPRIEHIVVDGGSTDGTVELLRERGVRFISEPDRGQTEAINKGFALATGDWLGWLNADDALAPRAVELTVAALEAEPEAGWAYGNNSVLIGGVEEPVSQPPTHLDVRALANGNLVPQAGSLVARWALERVGPLDEDFDLTMDYDLWLRLIDAGVRSVYVPDTVATFELHEHSKSGSIDRSAFRLEWAISLLKHSHRRAATLMLGRAAAAAAQADAQRIDRSRLEHEIAAAAGRARSHTTDVDLRTLRASAYAEAALLELHLRPRGFAYLLRPEPWLSREPRTRLFAVLARGAVRRLRRS
jgi:GT2 family glycosyltransferase